VTGAYEGVEEPESGMAHSFLEENGSSSMETMSTNKKEKRIHYL
jgi:hypothetical protein